MLEEYQKGPRSHLGRDCENLIREMMKVFREKNDFIVKYWPITNQIYKNPCIYNETD